MRMPVLVACIFLAIPAANGNLLESSSTALDVDDDYYEEKTVYYDDLDSKGAAKIVSLGVQSGKLCFGIAVATGVVAGAPIAAAAVGAVGVAAGGVGAYDAAMKLKGDSPMLTCDKVSKGIKVVTFLAGVAILAIGVVAIIATGGIAAPALAGVAVGGMTTAAGGAVLATNLANDAIYKTFCGKYQKQFEDCVKGGKTQDVCLGEAKSGIDVDAGTDHAIDGK